MRKFGITPGILETPHFAPDRREVASPTQDMMLDPGRENVLKEDDFGKAGERIPTDNPVQKLYQEVFKMNAIIVSDLHIGSRYFLYQDFERFLENISEDHELVLNGDIIDNPYTKLKSLHQRILDIIAKRSYRQKVVWVQGNHDNGYVPTGFERVHLKRLHAIDHKLLIAHGHDFDQIMPRNQTFIKVFKFMHNIRVKLGARPVHVANYAKKWEIFYKVLRKNIMMNAVDCAMENGYEAVTCGHTHYPEDRIINGIRYLNTGSWTEYPIFYLLVTDGEMTLKKVGDSISSTLHTSPSISTTS